MILSFLWEGKMVELEGLKAKTTKPQPLTESFYSLVGREGVEHELVEREGLTIEQRRELQELWSSM